MMLANESAGRDARQSRVSTGGPATAIARPHQRRRRASAPVGGGNRLGAASLEEPGGSDRTDMPPMITPVRRRWGRPPSGPSLVAAGTPVDQVDDDGEQPRAGEEPGELQPVDHECAHASMDRPAAAHRQHLDGTPTPAWPFLTGP